MSNPTDPTRKQIPRSRWRFWRLSLRQMMILVLIAGGVLGWKARRASIQRRAVAEIKAANAWVLYDFELSPQFNPTPGGSPKVPNWLREPLGDELFQEVAGVVLGDWRATAPVPLPAIAMNALGDCDHLRWLMLHAVSLDDPKLGQIADLSSLESLQLNLRGKPPDHWTSLLSLRRLKRLRHLRIDPSPREDLGLEFLRGLNQLESVFLPRTEITDAGVALLATLPKLYWIEMNGSRVTDAGLAQISKNQSLKALEIASPDHAGQFSDQGLAQLGKIPNLVRLSIDMTKIGESGLDPLLHLPLYSIKLTGLEPRHEGSVRRLLTKLSLSTITLSGTGVTDDWLAPLAAQAKLDWLDLSETRVTDPGMEHFVTLPMLRVVHLQGTELTDAGVAKLLKIPTLKYLWAQGTRATPSAGQSAFQAGRASVQITTGPVPPK